MTGENASAIGRLHTGLRAAIAWLLLSSCASLAASPVAAEPHADLVVVLKADRALYLYHDGMPFKRYRIALGDNPDGDKLREGDGRTPVGSYTLDWRNPESDFYKSIHVSYPDANDRRQAARRGADPGGLIMIHGQPSYDDRPRDGDWTNGCIAVSDKAMDEIWELVPEDTPIHIYP